MRHGSLFSGIGGFDLASSWMGWTNVFQVEKDEWCQKVLAKNFPTTKRYGDIKEFDGTPYRGAIDILTGGFPCQPYSIAGQRKGKNDDRHLWPEFNRIVGEIKPRFIVGENVRGLLSWDGGVVFREVCADLDSNGYEVTGVLLPASGVGAWHRRERIWIVAHSRNDVHPVRLGFGESEREEGSNQEPNERTRQASFRERLRASTPAGYQVVADTHSAGLEELDAPCFAAKQGLHTGLPFEGRSYWATEPGVGRVANGVPHRVDRIKGLGNAIVPQVAFEIFKAIQATTLEPPSMNQQRKTE